jgi:hypothetical protein
MRRPKNPAVLGGSALLFAAASAVSTSSVHGVPTIVQSIETPSCDLLPNLVFVDELGNPPFFPQNELISSSSNLTALSACPASDNASIPNRLVRIQNLSGIAWQELYYVADPAAAGLPGTTLSNEDGFVNSGQAFRIDRLGMNRPLVAENGIVDGIFQPGEIWRFVIDDYVSGAGLMPHSFDSIGVGNLSPGGPSSGSIIAVIPEPGTITCIAAGLFLLTRRRARAG